MKVENTNVQIDDQNGNKSRPLLSSRLLKFRAWDEKEKYMAVQGTLDLETLQSFIFYFGGDILMQFTGMKDKNKVDIYEGDLIVYSKIKGMSMIRFEKGSFFFYGKATTQFLWNIEEKEIEVIGNIFENPELL